MNSENSKTPKPYVLILKLTNKLNLRMGKKVISLSNLTFITHGKNKAHTITINLKYLHQYGMMNLNCQMDLILYHIFKIILSLFKTNMGKV